MVHTFDKTDYPRVGETIYKYRHTNGLSAIVVPKTGYQRKYANFATNYGSVDNRFSIEGEDKVWEVPDGVAHFLEHKLFEDEDEDVMHKFSRNGATPNAYTSFSKTVYLFSCTRNFSDNMRLLLDFVQTPSMTDESIEKEKGIIKQEIDMYIDNPGWSIYFNLMKALYEKNPVRIEIAGSAESIEKIDKDILYKCHECFYNPKNMILVVVGDVDPEEVFNIVDNSIVTDKKPINVKKQPHTEPEGIKQKKITRKMDVSAPMFMMGFKETPKAEKGVLSLETETAMEMILDMVAGRSTSFYDKLYSSALINDTFEYEYTAERDFTFTLFGGESPDPEKTAEKIYNEIARIAGNGFDKVDFERVRRANMGRFIRGFNSMDFIARNFVYADFNGASLLDYIDIYDRINIDFVFNVFKSMFNPDNSAISVIEPI